MQRFVYRNRHPKKLLLKLKKINNSFEQEKEILKQELTTFPVGSLHIKNISSRPVCYKQKNHKEKSINKNTSDAKLLARKMQAMSEMNDTNVILDTLGKTITSLENYLEEQKTKKGHITLENLPEIFDYESFALNKKERFILNKYKEDCQWHPENLTYKTNCGIYVRSKSEMIIADILYEYGIMFLYEPKLTFGTTVVHPDFLIIRNDGSIFIWEHFGLLDNPDYKKQTEWKIDLYGKNGFKQHTNLICTYESDILTKKILRIIVEERLV